jgi:hypothetical protein
MILVLSWSQWCSDSKLGERSSIVPHLIVTETLKPVGWQEANAWVARMETTWAERKQPTRAVEVLGQGRENDLVSPIIFLFIFFYFVFYFKF